MKRLSLPTRPILQPAVRTLGLAVLLWLATASVSVAEALRLKVGVVQHFGDRASDEIEIEAAGGGAVVVEFEGGDGTRQTQTLDTLTLDIAAKSLDRPVLEERVVLSTHRSFENAEQSAEDWRDRGIEVEIAQPSDIWQVWAKRSVYRTPLLRRLLIENIEAQGLSVAYLKNSVRDRRPQAGWVSDGFRYNRDYIDISADSGALRVVQDDTTRVYGGDLRLQPDAYGTYTLVNDVPIETYLRGVVPHEIGPQAPYAAVEAQAIVARTYAVRNRHRFAVDGYEICADTHCQVYRGLTGTVDKADRAIAATAGQVLTYDGEPIDALYSSTTGGVTASFADVWLGESRPYLVPRVDSVSNIWDLQAKPLDNEANFRAFMALDEGFNEDGWDVFRWRESTSLDAMTEFLKRYYNRNNRTIDFTAVKQVDIVERSPSGRVLAMTITTDSGTIEIPNDEIRNAFYPPISTLFYIDPIYRGEGDDKVLDGYTFVGGGFGHGVGMSQTGSYRLAEIGKSSREILAFYYPGTELRSLSDDVAMSP